MTTTRPETTAGFRFIPLLEKAGDLDLVRRPLVALAHRYFDMIRAGKTYSEIAATEGASKRRVQKIVELSFLAPDIIRDAFDGHQPTGLTSEWLVRHSFSPIWQEQREMFRAL